LLWFPCDASLSSQSYDSFWDAIKKTQPQRAAEVLLRFFKTSRQTFYASKWTDKAVVHIVIGDMWSNQEEQAAKYLVSQIWKDLKDQPTESKMGAFEALRFMELGPERSIDDEIMAENFGSGTDDASRNHRSHWLALAGWIRRRELARKKPSKFADDAVTERNPAPCRCVPDEVVRLMAAEFAENPNLAESPLVDQTLAKRHKTSARTIQRLRGKLRQS
jgi:hypothetical protein